MTQYKINGLNLTTTIRWLNVGFWMAILCCICSLVGFSNSDVQFVALFCLSSVIYAIPVAILAAGNKSIKVVFREFVPKGERTLVLALVVLTITQVVILLSADKRDIACFIVGAFLAFIASYIDGKFKAVFDREKFIQNTRDFLNTVDKSNSSKFVVQMPSMPLLIDATIHDRVLAELAEKNKTIEELNATIATLKQKELS